MEKDLQSLCKFAKKSGAVNAKVISVDTVVTAPWVRLKCQYGCDGYGECLTCPPYSPTPEKTREVLKQFRKAILIHGDDYTDIRGIVAKLERKAFLSGYYKAYGMGAGPCDLCNTCNVNKTCKKPYEARPSMEASGIDVYQTARNNGYKIEVLKSDDCKGNYFGLVLIL
ncbi:MAG TPA: DUF2284 domain-containing protein [bacterium]|nr:DUF2284 domain-containing protein [bacterium]